MDEGTSSVAVPSENKFSTVEDEMRYLETSPNLNNSKNKPVKQCDGSKLTYINDSVFGFCLYA